MAEPANDESGVFGDWPGDCLGLARRIEHSADRAFGGDAEGVVAQDSFVLDMLRQMAVQQRRQLERELEQEDRISLLIDDQKLSTEQSAIHAQALVVIDNRFTQVEQQLEFQGILIGVMLALQTIILIQRGWSWWRARLKG